MTTFLEALQKAVASGQFCFADSSMFEFMIPYSRWELDSKKFDLVFKSHPVETWVCTDTTVGLYAISCSGILVGYTAQSGRKMDKNLTFLDKSSYNICYTTLLACVTQIEDDSEFAVADPELLAAPYNLVNPYENYSGVIMGTTFPVLESKSFVITPRTENIDFTVQYNGKTHTISCYELNCLENVVKKYKDDNRISLETIYGIYLQDV